MSYGIQTFVKGTSFDAINSIDFNYVIDSFTVSSSGSKSYSLQSGMQMNAVIFNENTPTNKDLVFNLSVSGGTLTWNVNATVTIIVFVSY